MANDLATTPPGAPPQIGEPRAATEPVPWQEAPPGPPGAAIDPPPCITPKVVAAQLEARATAAEDEAVYPPLMNAMDFCHVVSWQAPFKAVVPTPRGPAEATFEPVHLGKPTPIAELEKRARAAGWTPPTEDQMRK